MKRIRVICATALPLALTLLPVRGQPGQKHWHGAVPTTGMTHIAIQEEELDGKSVAWLEPVTDEQYGK
jgi:hypothetical protein